MVLGVLGLDVTPKGLANYLMDSSYGKTFSSAAATLRGASSWDKVKTVNWGFTNKTAGAKDGFINGLAASLRPLNNILSVFLAEGKLDILENLDVPTLVKSLLNQFVKAGSTEIFADAGELSATLKYAMKGDKFVLTIQSYGVTGKGNRTLKSVVEIDVDAICQDIQKVVDRIEIGIGTNGYENASIGIIAFS